MSEKRDPAIEAIIADLNRAYPQGVSAHDTPAGVAIGMPILLPDGDEIGFYLIKGDGGTWRIEDDGFAVPILMATGVDIDCGESASAFADLLGAAGARFDRDSGELRTEWLSADAVPAAALRFATMMMGVCDLTSGLRRAGG
jgi:hypothetical protein